VRQKIWFRAAGFWETAYFHVAPPRVPWSTAAGPLGPPGHPWGPLDMFWHMYLGGLEHIEAYTSHNIGKHASPEEGIKPGESGESR
jgi:hypothetical protein